MCGGEQHEAAANGGIESVSVSARRKIISIKSINGENES